MFGKLIGTTGNRIHVQRQLWRDCSATLLEDALQTYWFHCCVITQYTYLLTWPSTQEPGFALLGPPGESWQAAIQVLPTAAVVFWGSGSSSSLVVSRIYFLVIKNQGLASSGLRFVYRGHQVPWYVGWHCQFTGKIFAVFCASRGKLLWLPLSLFSTITWENFDRKRAQVVRPIMGNLLGPWNLVSPC